MVQHIVIVKWRPDAAAEELAAVMAFADTALAQGDFVSYRHGPSLKVSGGAGDWGMVLDLEGPEGVEKWLASEPHEALAQRIAPLKESVLSIQLPSA
ncbi:MAG TPA: hypothetical protein VHB02_12040 [Acidimicrobiales bacterium]|nr:hypothetical protein [Acidimicrobiales bacterium]